MEPDVVVWGLDGRLVGHIDANRRAIPARGERAGQTTGRVENGNVMSGGLTIGWVDGDKIMYMGPGMGGPIQAGRVDGTSVFSCNRVGDERQVGSISHSDKLAAAAALILLNWRE